MELQHEQDGMFREILIVLLTLNIITYTERYYLDLLSNTASN